MKAIAPALFKTLAAEQWRRPPVERVELRLTLPPSANRLWAPAGPSAIRLTKRYAAWKRVAAAEIAAQRPGMIDGRYVLEMLVSTRSGMDLDNTIKPVSDALQDAGVIHNDSLARRIVIEGSDAIDGVEVVLTPWRAA